MLPGWRAPLATDGACGFSQLWHSPHARAHTHTHSHLLACSPPLPSRPHTPLVPATPTPTPQTHMHACEHPLDPLDPHNAKEAHIFPAPPPPRSPPPPRPPTPTPHPATCNSVSSATCAHTRSRVSPWRTASRAHDSASLRRSPSHSAAQQPYISSAPCVGGVGSRVGSGTRWHRAVKGGRRGGGAEGGGLCLVCGRRCCLRWRLRGQVQGGLPPPPPSLASVSASQAASQPCPCLHGPTSPPRPAQPPEEALDLPPSPFPLPCLLVRPPARTPALPPRRRLDNVAWLTAHPAQLVHQAVQHAPRAAVRGQQPRQHRHLVGVAPPVGVLLNHLVWGAGGEGGGVGAGQDGPGGGGEGGGA